MKYFVFNGTNAKFVDSINNDITILGLIKWQYDTYICCDEFVKNKLNTVKFQVKEYDKFTVKHLPILRSQLQKSVRRELSDICMKTAITMCNIYDINKQIGLFEMLRRITIITIEDAILCEDFGILVWFICAISKNLFVNDYFVKLILNIVSGISFSPLRDKAFKNLRKEYKLTCIPNNDLLLSIQLRNSFHGMECDVNMLNQVTDIWYNRINNDSPLCKFLIKKYDYENNECLKKEEIMLEALDHHCTNICSRIQSYFNIDDDKLKSLIWNNSSSINTRVHIDPSQIQKIEVDDDWKIIKNIFIMETQKIKLQIF